MAGHLSPPVPLHAAPSQACQQVRDPLVPGRARWVGGDALMVAVPSVHVSAGRQHVPPEPAGGGAQRGVGRHRWQGAGRQGTREGWQGQDSLARQLTCQVGSPPPCHPSIVPTPWVMPTQSSLLVSVCPRVVQSPKRMPSGRGGRDRFTAESYTVLGEIWGHPLGCRWGTLHHEGMETRRREGGSEGTGGDVGGHGAPRRTWRGWGQDGATHGCPRESRALCLQVTH